MRKLLVCALLLLSSCIAPRTMRYVNAPDLEPTRARDVQVLTAVPKGATVLGEVEGTGLGMFGSAEANAREGAAAMGADAIVIYAEGEDPVPDDLFGRSRPVVRAKALRLRE